MATEYEIDENGMYEMIGAKTIKTYKEITDSRNSTPLAKTIKRRCAFYSLEDLINEDK